MSPLLLIPTTSLCSPSLLRTYERKQTKGMSTRALQEMLALINKEVVALIRDLLSGTQSLGPRVDAGKTWVELSCRHSSLSHGICGPLNRHLFFTARYLTYLTMILYTGTLYEALLLDQACVCIQALLGCVVGGFRY